MSIAVSKLTKIYGEQKAVDDISFSIPKGEVVGFLGPNGAGKSTTMKILTGYLPATSGEASVCGLPVDDHPIEIKKRVGYLPESNPLYPEMYIKECLSFTAHIYGVPHASKRIEEMIALTGLTSERRKKIGALSKGYKQRVGLAQALLHDPEVLILDEPTSGLDPNQLVEIRHLIRELGKDKTVMLSTHIMQEVQAICDRVIIINLGKIVADDKLSHIQMAAADTVLTITFSENVSEGVLKTIPEIKEVHQSSPLVWNITTAVPEAVKKSLWQLALQNNLNIVSLQSNTVALEDVFRKLTKGE
ncbi:MAG: gliding motility-associated ABC transporter ATP-binding subunit GldA [Chitinophagaceae bacterium]|jgi:ABC-2 type transport system ATP-binding protein|nr:MAG: gliding motility-associated ABC transporter ATP-binding subunit GldA [Chitinophagaceae bacterium]